MASPSTEYIGSVHQGRYLLTMNSVRAIGAALEPSQSDAFEAPEIQAPARQGSPLWLPLVALITVIVCLPFVRAIFWIHDEGVVLHGADRLLRGSRLYTDFFEFLPPGSFAITALWFSIAGNSFLSARILAILTIVGIACFAHLASWKASRNAPLSAFLVIGWVAMSQGTWTQISHHWFTTLFAMVAAWAALASLQPSRVLRWPLIAGAAAGAAATITPTRGALATLAALTAFLNLRQSRTGAITYVLGVMLAPMGLLVYLALNHSLAAAFDDVIRFPASRYAAIQYVPFGYYASTSNFFLKYLFPLAAALTILVCARDWRCALRDHPLHLCIAFGIAGFIGCFPRPDISHIAFSVPLIYPLLALCVSRLSPDWRPELRSAFAAAAALLHIPSVLVLFWLAQLVLGGEVVSTPRGDVQAFQFPGQVDQRDKVLARIASLPPRDSVFFYPILPMLPFLTGREQAAKYDIFLPYYTLPAQYHEACISMMWHASWLVVDNTWMGAGKWKAVYPAMPAALPPETIEFERVLDRGFEFVAQDGTFELRRRRAEVKEDICAGLATRWPVMRSPRHGSQP